MVLSVKNITVRYRLDSYKNMRWEKKLLRSIRGRRCQKDFYAIKNVSFDLNEGEVLGIIGKNGSGKSTLLKALAGTVSLKSGRIDRVKKVSALLELGTGFDRDMTVKENIFLRGALLGFSKKYICERYKDILKFAELEEYEDYVYDSLSSGMRSRMAFSIVSIMQPQILVLDEVFSVGDGAFKKKSYDKMLELMNYGVSTIMVSHSMNQVRNLCTRILWLDHGNLIMDGPTETVCKAYGKFLQTGELPVDENKL